MGEFDELFSEQNIKKIFGKSVSINKQKNIKDLPKMDVKAMLDNMTYLAEGHLMQERLYYFTERLGKSYNRKAYTLDGHDLRQVMVSSEVL